MHETDVLVLGGGIAGVAAALAAAAAGARTSLVRSGPGATTVCGGGWRGLPPQPLLDRLADAGLRLEPCEAALPHPDGRLLSFDVAAPAQLRARVAGTPERTLVCGIAGLPSFRATALAALWADAAELPEDVLVPATIQLPDTPAAGWSAVALGAHVERHPAALAEAVGRLARERGAARVILPAVLGMQDHEGVCAALGSEAGAVIGEALGAAPSLPGWRLDRMLLRALERGGVPVLSGFVTEHTAAHGAVRIVTVARSEDTVVIQARAVVLATGKFLGGGITAQSRFAESALNTEISADHLGREITEPAESLTLTDAVRGGPQPMMRIGVRTNDEGHPITASGDVVFHNVIAAGSVRAGTETASLGLGNAACDGWTAGIRAAGIAARA
jgi:glycerol-3-phosphate dehydrogenase subunit B